MINVEEHYVSTPLRHELSLTVFIPESSDNYSLIISSATGVLQRYYKKFSNYFSELGYTVYTFDYSGIGKSNSNTKALKNNHNDLRVWGENDQSAIIDFALKQNPNHKIVLLTHSIGGQILCFNTNISKLSAIITVASQSGYWKHWQGLERGKMYLFWNLFIPATTPFFGYFPAKLMGLFENLPKHMVYQWRRWALIKDYMLSEFKKEDLQFLNYTKSMLALSFPKDEYAPESAVDWFANQFENATVDRRHIIPEEHGIPNVGHFGFFRETFKDSLWNMVHNWIAENS